MSEATTETTTADTDIGGTDGSEQTSVESSTQESVLGDNQQSETKDESILGKEDDGQQADSNDNETAKEVPESYEIKLSDEFGEMELDQTLLAEFEPFAKDAKLSNDEANKLANLYAKHMKGMVEQQQQAMTELKENWLKELKQDKDFAGEKYNENVQYARNGIMKFGGKALSQTLVELGIDNHPALVKAFAQIGKALSEDKLVLGNNAPKLTTAQQLYPNSNMNP